MKKQILLTSIIALTATLTNAQDRFAIGLRTGVTSTFHLKKPDYPQDRNHIGYNAAVTNQLFTTYSLGKNRQLLLETGVGYTQRKETSSELFYREQGSHPIRKIRTEHLRTITPSLRLSYRVAQMKNIDWKHYAGVTISHDLDFYKSKTVGNSDISPDYESNYNAGTTNAGLHYNGIIGITKKLSVNYLFSVTSFLGYKATIFDTRSYHYNGMFGLSYKL